MLQCVHVAFTLLRHLPALEKSYSVPVVGCKKAEKGRAGGPVHTVKLLHAALVQEMGVKEHRELGLLGQYVVEEGVAIPVRTLPKVL